jgi:hypothetical protein
MLIVSCAVCQHVHLLFTVSHQSATHAERLVKTNLWTNETRQCRVFDVDKYHRRSSKDTCAFEILLIQPTLFIVRQRRDPCWLTTRSSRRRSSRRSNSELCVSLDYNRSRSISSDRCSTFGMGFRWDSVNFSNGLYCRKSTRTLPEKRPNCFTEH